MASGGPVIALDVGGTAVKSAIVRPSGTLAGPPRRTPIDAAATADAVLDTLAGAVHALTHAAIAGVAVAFPGPCDYERAIPGRHDDGKFAALAGLPLADELRGRLGRRDLPMCFCNDAEAAIVAEALFGAGRAFERVLGITLGAGLGACLVAGGETIVEACGTVVPGELYRHRFGEAVADDVFSDRGLRARLARAGAGAADPALARDPHALRAFEAFGADLGRFLGPWTVALRVDAVVVAGGIAAAFALFGPALDEQLAVDVRAGELGVAAGLVGAAQALRGRVRRVAEQPGGSARVA
jgi:glucokinase